MTRTWRATSGVTSALLALGMALAAGGDGALAQDQPTIYVIAPSLTDPFWITQQNGANQAGEDFGVNVVFQAPAQDTGDAGMVPLLQAAIAAQPAGKEHPVKHADPMQMHAAVVRQPYFVCLQNGGQSHGRGNA